MVNSLFAIITIDPVEPGEKDGLSGEIDFTFKASGGNTEVEDNDFGSKVQYDNNSSLFVHLLVYNFKEGRVEDSMVVKRSFAHYRFVKQLSAIAAVELYGQAERDQFKNLNLRKLLGSGMRYKFVSTDTHKFYFGFGGYYSEEFYTAIDSVEEHRYLPRLNSYISYTDTFEHFIAALTLYYQPSLKNFKDTNIVSDGSLTYKLTDTLALKIAGSYKKDTDPALGNKKEDSFYSTSISYTF
jgi:putative salt-induced outer membrane protein YdiY